MERLVAWELSGQAGQKARGMVIVKFVNWATNQLDSRTFNSDLDSDEAAKIIKSIKKNLRKFAFFLILKYLEMIHYTLRSSITITINLINVKIC